MAKKRRIYLEPMDDDTNWPLPGGWYGPKAGVYINEYIYCRHPKKKDGAKFEKWEAFEIVQDMQRMGYDARCVPPVKVKL